MILCIIVINFVVRGPLCKLKGLHFIKINCQLESRDSLTGTAKVSCEWFFSSPCSKIQLFLALVAPGNCCHAYISIDTLGGAGFSFSFSFFFCFPAVGRRSGKEGEKNVIGEMNPGDHWFLKGGRYSSLFPQSGHGTMKCPLFNSDAWIVAGSMGKGSPLGCKGTKIQLETKI